ncbi:nSTAND1 domain-containing NTPase [Agromyces humatus]|uniref:OmpR/PhoB-type domain-containing protein n=1 Tax=Agromyces humatus TaxID=279573 RepID=A0ABN2KXW2_9MICO|nr:BTAD domain-containing putative transcriptional regulator [Agromyces humatus]
MEIGVLGPVTVGGGAVALSPRDRVVLAALVARAGETVSASELADALWRDAPPASWTKVVPGCVMRLRRALGGAGAIETVGSAYRLVVERVEIDAVRFRQRVARGHELQQLGEPDRAVHVFAEALELWRGRAYSDSDEASLVRVEATALEELRDDTEEALVTARLEVGALGEVIGEAQSLVAQEPLREKRWALLAQAQYRAGRQSDALQTLRDARATLVEELGLDPGPDLVELERAILRHDSALHVGEVSTPPSRECPYFGLVPAGLDDADLFFGRERELRSWLPALAESGVLVIAGPSGVGKSSLARAGVAAALRAQGRTVSVITPGARPMAALEAGISSGPRALIVDQCEEALVLCQDLAERGLFFRTLAESFSHDLLVITLRADRLGDLANHPEFARLVERNLVLLGPLDADGLRSVIERPARQAGLLLEPGLVDLLLRDVADEPGALPLLSHALRQTWLRREGRTLTVSGYAEAGGISGAVAQTAEQLYGELSDEQRARLQSLLLRLVDATPQSLPTRRRMPLDVVASDPRRAELVRLLVDARLLTSDDGTVEVAHEALARAWPRLTEWLEQDVDGQRILRHLTATAEAWDAMSRPDSELYRGARLSAALAWRDAASPELTSIEESFLDASVGREQADLRAATLQLAREKRSVAWLRRLAAGAAVLALVAAGAAAFAFIERQRADDRALVAEARRISARALVDRPYDRALLLATEAIGLWDSVETRGSLLNTLQRSPLASRVIRSGDAPIIHFDLSSDTSRAVVVDSLENLALIETEGRAPIAGLSDEGTSYIDAELSPDGRSVAVSSVNVECWFADCRDVAVRLVDADDLSGQGTRLGGFPLPVADVSFSHDAAMIAAIAPIPWYPAPGNIAVWHADELDAPAVVMDLTELGENPALTPDRFVFGTVEFAPDGQTLYASGYGSTVAFDTATGEARATYGGLGLLGVSPDGHSIALVGTGNEALLQDTATGATIELVGHTAHVRDAAFSPDGALVATVGNDHTAMVWDARTGERNHVLEAHVGAVHGVEFGPSGALFTAGADGAVIEWDLTGDSGLFREVLTERPLEHVVAGVPFVAPHGERVVVMGETSVDLIEVTTGVVRSIPSGTARWAAFHPDGDRFATVTGSGVAELWDAPTGELVARSDPGAANGGALAFTPDGRSVVVAERSGDVRILDARTLEQLRPTIDVGVPATGIRAADGVVAVTSQGIDTGSGTEVVFADVNDGAILRRVELDSWGVRAAFSPDGSRYAFGGRDGDLGVLDIATGEVVYGSTEPIHQGPVSWVVFTGDGESLISLGYDGEVVVSSGDSAVPFARLSSAQPSMAAHGVFSDATMLRIGYADGSVAEFDTDPGLWARHACTVAGRDLTASEWQDAFGAREYRPTCGGLTGLAGAR